MDSSVLKEKFQTVTKKVSHYCKKALNKTQNWCNYINKEFRERWSGYDSISEDQEPLLSEESRNDVNYQYQPDNLPVKNEKPKTYYIFNSVSKTFKSYYSDVSNDSYDENQTRQVHHHQIVNQIHQLIESKKFYL